MKTKKLTLIAATLLLSAIACKSEKKPDETVKLFFDAVAHKNYDQAAKYCTPESSQSLADLKKAAEMQNKPVEENVANLKKMKFANPEIKDDSAFVNVTTEKITKPMVYTLVKSNGEWVLDLSPTSMKRMIKNQ